MKKIGVFFGIESHFPSDLINVINSKGNGEIIAETAQIGGVCAKCNIDYDLLLDRVSVESPYFHSIMKVASLNGKLVINNPFRLTSIDALANYSIANNLKLNTPKSILIPIKQLPYGATGDTFRNLIYPLNWDEIFEHVGFPAYIKPIDIPGWLKVYKVYNKHEFFSAYDLTGSSTVFVQESIDFDYMARVFVIGASTRTVPYYPFRPLYARFQRDEHFIATEKEISKFEKIAKQVCNKIGFDINTVDFGVKDGKIFVLDFLNPAPTFEPGAMEKIDYDWALDVMSDLLIQTINGKYKLKSSKEVIYNEKAPSIKKSRTKEISLKKNKD